MFHDPRRDGGPVPRFNVTEVVIEEGCREISLEGELDLAVAGRLQEAIADCGSDRILIDLSACRFIDSSGIAVILKANTGNDSRVVLHSPSGQVLRLLELTGLASNGLVFADREQALATVRSDRLPAGD